MTGVHDAHEALAIMHDKCPDVVIVDLDNPRTNGDSFVRKIGMLPIRPYVVILSDFDPHAAQERLRTDGALQKPFDPLALVEIVEGCGRQASRQPRPG